MTTIRHQQLLDDARRAYDARDLERAKALCEQLLAGSGKNVNALHLLGLVLIAQERFDEAVPPLQRCAALRPKEVMAQLTLARAQAHRGNYRAALDRFDKALRLEPKMPAAVNGKAEVFYARGDHTRVLSLLEPIVRAGAEDADMGLNVARSRNATGRPDEALEMIARHAEDAGASPETKRQLRFLRGKILEKREEYDEAFAAYVAANAVEPGRYDADAYGRRVDDIIEAFGPEIMDALPRARHGIDLPVLVVGMPRTGSTLIERLIDAHPLAGGAGETLFLPGIVNDLALGIGSTRPYPFCVRDLDEEYADQAGRAYALALKKVARGVKRVVDKNLFNYEKVGLLALVMPGAHIIDCRRDPVDTCLSCFTEALSPDGHPYASRLETLGRRYRDYERLMEHWRRVARGSLMTVSYEDLVTNQEAVSRRIIDFIGLPWDDRCLRFHESSFQTRTLSLEQVRRPIYRTSVRRSDRFGRHLDPLRTALGESASSSGNAG